MIDLNENIMREITYDIVIENQDEIVIENDSVLKERKTLL